MLTIQSVLADVQSVFDVVFLEPVVVRETLSARDVPEWDSVKNLTVVMSLEEQFGVRFAAGEVEATDNLGDLAALILRKKA